LFANRALRETGVETQDREDSSNPFASCDCDVKPPIRRDDNSLILRGNRIHISNAGWPDTIHHATKLGILLVTPVDVSL